MALARRSRTPASVVAVHLPRRRRGETLLVGYRPPRTTSAVPLGRPRTEALALAVAAEARPDATVVLTDRESAVEIRDGIVAVAPEAETFVADPVEVLRFLWFYRDRHDPMTLGHASDRPVLDFTFDHVKLPPYAGGARRTDRRRALEEIRELLLTMGASLGVRPPIPAPGASAGWNTTRIAGLSEAVAALYAGLLYRWGSPRVRTRPPEGGIVDLGLP